MNDKANSRFQISRVVGQGNIPSVPSFSQFFPSFSYLATHPDVGEAMSAAIDKSMNSLGIKAFAGFGVKKDLGPIKINASATLSVQSSVDGKKDGMSAQAAVGVRDSDTGHGIQALNVSTQLADSNGLVSPNLKISGPSLTTSQNLYSGPAGSNTVAPETGSLSDEAASAGVQLNTGILTVGAGVTDDISGWYDVAATMLSNAISDTKQLVTDLKESATCNGSTCAKPQ